MSGYVYAIGIKGTPLVKIGIAQDVAKRLAALQTGLPYTLVVLHQEQVEEPRQVERALHDILEAVRERGEWFELPEVYFPSLFAQGIACAEPKQVSPPQEANTLGKRIRRARMRRGWEQQELAKMIGVSRKTMNQIEQGKVDPRASLVVAIAHALKVSTDTLLVQYED